MSSVLSQEEINALLNDTFGNSSNDQQEEALTPVEKDTLGEIANISMGAAATTLASLLGKKVEITAPRVSITTLDELKAQYREPYVVVDVNYIAGLAGSNVLVIHTYDAGIIVDLMMGGDGSHPPLELNDLHLSAVSEAMNQMMGSACTSLSQILDKRINISPPVLDLVELDEQKILKGEERLIKISFRMIIQGLVDSEMMQLVPIQFGKNMVEEIMRKNNMIGPGTVKKTPQVKTPQVEITAASDSKPRPSLEIFKEPDPAGERQAKIAVSPVQFEPLARDKVWTSNPTNLDLILDVGLQLAVELGRTQKKIKDILELSVGAIVELDKLAGEPVDILVNGKLLAKGEVVVIDENFGVRVTEIVSPVERVKSLK